MVCFIVHILGLVFTDSYYVLVCVLLFF